MNWDHCPSPRHVVAPSPGHLVTLWLSTSIQPSLCPPGGWRAGICLMTCLDCTHGCLWLTLPSHIRSRVPVAESSKPQTPTNAKYGAVPAVAERKGLKALSAIALSGCRKILPVIPGMRVWKGKRVIPKESIVWAAESEPACHGKMRKLRRGSMKTMPIVQTQP